ncbi:MAG: putative toxin-antitoxin system toxin component, PIN family [Janthinobacterium lividum]
MLAPDLPTADIAAPADSSARTPPPDPLALASAASAPGAPATAVVAAPSAAAPRVVLDSNVWIDILVFDDPDSRPIRAALEAGALAAVIDPACLYELDRVLDYPQFARFALDKTATLATVARLTRLLDAPPPADDVAANNVATDANPARPMPVLPRCSDRDDQKFLELAARGGAHWLVTKDKALLKLARRFTRDFACRIDRPAGFVNAALPPVPAT